MIGQRKELFRVLCPKEDSSVGPDLDKDTALTIYTEYIGKIYSASSNHVCTTVSTSSRVLYPMKIILTHAPTSKNGGATGVVELCTE